MDELFGSVPAARSWSSGLRRADTARCLERKIQHAKHAEYGDRIVGYHPASGGTDEWYCYSSYRWFFDEPQRESVDFGPAQVGDFRRSLVESYDGDAGGLRHAWRDEAVGFEIVQPSSPAENQGTDLF